MSTHDRERETLPAAPEPLPGQTALGDPLAPEQLDLPTLAKGIRQHCDAADRDGQSAVRHAMRAGQGLNAAQEKVRHGEWLPWLEQNVGIPERTARRYMQLARNGHAVADLPTVREAVAQLTKPKAKPKAKSGKQGKGIREQFRSYCFVHVGLRRGQGRSDEQIARELHEAIDWALRAEGEAE